MGYPKFLYHRDFEPMLVKDEAQEKKLGPEWKESPKFDDKTPDTHPELGKEEIDPTIPRLKKAKK